MAAAKDDLRRTLLEARKRRVPEERARAAAANAAHLLTVMSGARVVCGDLPLPSEPLDRTLLDALVELGRTVLIPVSRTDAALDWCRYPSATTLGAFGIAEPTGARLGAEAVVGADVVLVPALAVDATGRRLGRGGGHYDRTLALLAGARQPELLAVLFDGELLDAVPGEHHDIRVTSVITPTAGWDRLRR